MGKNHLRYILSILIWGYAAIKKSSHVVHICFPQENGNRKNNNFYKILSYSHIFYYYIELMYITAVEKQGPFSWYIFASYLSLY